jgi:hypothetical protein
MSIASVTPKDPNSVEWFSWDFANMLRSGDSIVSLVEVAIDGYFLGLTIVDGSTGFDGSVVSAKLSGGTLGKKYKVRARVTTASGETLDLSFIVQIAHT